MAVEEEGGEEEEKEEEGGEEEEEEEEGGGEKSPRSREFFLSIASLKGAFVESMGTGSSYSWSTSDALESN